MNNLHDTVSNTASTITTAMGGKTVVVGTTGGFITSVVSMLQQISVTATIGILLSIAGFIGARKFQLKQQKAMDEQKARDEERLEMEREEHRAKMNYYQSHQPPVLTQQSTEKE